MSLRFPLNSIILLSERLLSPLASPCSPQPVSAADETARPGGAAYAEPGVREALLGGVALPGVHDQHVADEVLGCSPPVTPLPPGCRGRRHRPEAEMGVQYGSGKSNLPAMICSTSNGVLSS